MPTIVPDIDLEALDHVPRCPICRRPYGIRVDGKTRTLAPDHKPWCRNRRTTTEGVISTGGNNPEETS